MSPATSCSRSSGHILAAAFQGICGSKTAVSPEAPLPFGGRGALPPSAAAVLVERKAYTMKCDEIVTAALADRTLLYTYLWRAFCDEPDQAFLDAIVDPAISIALGTLLGEESDAVKAQGRLASLASERGALERLKGDYVRLFIGPGRLPAPPWESVYITGERLLFQQSTLDVREVYRLAGYQSAGYPHEADDHLATELGFMRALASDSERACISGDDERLAVLLSRQIMFLSEHVNAWVPRFADELSVARPRVAGDFYRLLASMAQDVCAADLSALMEVVEYGG